MTDPLQQLAAALAGRYSVERIVGRGGMATVYLAHDERHGRDVAVKVLKGDLAQRLGADRFLREIRIAAQLQHPHILPLYDSGSADELLFYVMPFVRGESLRALLNRERVLDVDRAVAVAGEVAGALDYAHRQGVVHRDIKPENVLLSEGHALVADFGIAKALDAATDEPLTRTGMAIGTPGYMSPEQAAGSSDLDARTDVFSLACVVYEMVVGEVPARWIPEEEVRQRRFLRAPGRHRGLLDRLPDGLESTLVRAMALDREARFPTPGAFAAALSGGPPPDRRYADEEARAVIGRAAEMDAAEPTHDGFGLGTVKDIARQAEIPSRFVDAAARELDRPRAPAPPALKPVRVLGLPAGISLSRTVPGEVPEAEFPVLVEMIEEELGTHGRVDALFRNAFVWSSEDVGSPARRGFSATRIQVTPRDGHTRITINDDRTPAVAVSIGVAAALAGALILPMARMWEAAAIMPAMGITVVGVAGLLRATWRRRRAQLQDLLDRLAQHVSATRR